MKRLLTAVALTTVATGLAPMQTAIAQTSTAQTWPTRPVTMVVPFGAGAGTDVIGRILADRLSQVLGAQVVVENAGGAGGMNGSARVAKAAPDGYQFVLGTVGTHSQNQSIYKAPLYDARTDFAPVALVVDVPPVLIARKDLPVDGLKAFIAYAKENQSKMSYGSSGTGSAAQLACALLNAQSGIDITHVPYRSAPAAMQDLVASRIDYQCGLLASTLPQIQNGDVKAIAVLTKERSPAMPNLASAHEQGLTGFEASAWHGVFFPKDTPPEIVEKLNKALSETLDTPSVQERLAKAGAIVTAPERRSPDYLRQFVASETAKWAEAIKTAKIEKQ
ncbi:MAG: tripartite tricarboxylate transporter substrate binding protein [Pseudolabrys sp.]|nr:tripartite tricarboxylate transporter substrate binding protein [Pseudolabrys sp.]